MAVVPDFVIVRPALAVGKDGAARARGHLKRLPSRVLLEQVAAITKPLVGNLLHISEGHHLARIGLSRGIE